MNDLFVQENTAKDRFNKMLREADHRRLVQQARQARKAASGCSVWERAWNSVMQAFAPLLGRSERTAPGAC
jgi:hypothetical protein